MSYDLIGLSPSMARNLCYVVGLVEENQGMLMRFEVMRDTRLRDKTGKIGFLDAYNAVVMAEKKGIIVSRRVNGDERFARQGLLGIHNDLPRYFTGDFDLN